jgi:hypothetical protein
MENVTFSNRDLQITSVFFKQNNEQVRFESFPRQLTYQGRTYVLADQ